MYQKHYSRAVLTTSLAYAGLMFFDTALATHTAKALELTPFQLGLVYFVPSASYFVLSALIGRAVRARGARDVLIAGASCWALVGLFWGPPAHLLKMVSQVLPVDERRLAWVSLACAMAIYGPAQAMTFLTPLPLAHAALTRALRRRRTAMAGILDSFKYDVAKTYEVRGVRRKYTRRTKSSRGLLALANGGAAARSATPPKAIAQQPRSFTRSSSRAWMHLPPAAVKAGGANSPNERTALAAAESVLKAATRDVEELSSGLAASEQLARGVGSIVGSLLLGGVAMEYLPKQRVPGCRAQTTEDCTDSFAAISFGLSCCFLALAVLVATLPRDRPPKRRFTPFTRIRPSSGLTKLLWWNMDDSDSDDSDSDSDSEDEDDEDQPKARPSLLHRLRRYLGLQKKGSPQRSRTSSTCSSASETSVSPPYHALAINDPGAPAETATRERY